MGTYRILRALWQHWTSRTNPIYCLDSRRMAPTRITSALWRHIPTLSRSLTAVAFVVGAMILAGFLCGGPRIFPWYRGLTSLASIWIGGLIALVLILLIYLWPVAVAVNTSSIIVAERERQTWDLLLTTPFSRDELALAKLASSLRLFNPYAELLLWTQSFMIGIVFVVVGGHMAQLPQLDVLATLLNILVVVAAMFEFAAARLQDYVLASLIGLTASLLSPTRQTAWAVALLASLAMVLIRAMSTAAIVVSLRNMSAGLLVVLLATGPASAIAVAWSAPVVIMALVAIVLAREVLIRAVFRWLAGHLGEAPNLKTA